MLRRVALRVIEGGQVAGFAAGDLLMHQLSAFDQNVDALIRRRLVHTDELCGDGGQLFPGNKAVAVAGVMYKLKKHGGTDAVFAVAVHAHFQGHGVRLGKAAADMLGGQDIRIIPQQRKGVVAVKLIHAHGQNRPQAEGADKLHQPPHPGLTAEAFGDLLRLGGADPPDFCQQLRGIFHHFQGLFPKFIDDQGGRGRAHATDRAPGQIVVYGVGRCGQQPLGKLRLELPPVDGVVHPAAGDNHGLPR